MKINRHIFHFPPYISTSWKTIAALYVEKRLEETILIVSLNDGARIEIPRLDSQVIQAIFTIHAKVLEQEQLPLQKQNPASIEPSQGSSPNTTAAAIGDNPVSVSLPIFPGMANIDNLGVFMQHNPEQSQAPDLPKEMMEKIATLSKAIGIQENNTLPRAEPHCNCYFCQIARAMQGDYEEESNPEEQETSIEEEVSEDDLKFRTWDIQQTADKLYLVSNPFDTKEYYSVFLGDPIGCTCGNKSCEHIRAVLST